MSRTLLYKTLYTVLILTLVLIFLVFKHTINTQNTLIMAICFLIPGRVQGYFWRDFFKGRYLLDNDLPDESITHSTSFLDTLRKSPELKILIWLSFSIYTRDVEAMTLNNLGAAYLFKKDFKKAEEYFYAAIALDKEYPIPYFNLSLSKKVNDNSKESEEYLAEARKKGYSCSNYDKLISKLQTSLAALETCSPN